MLHAQPFRTGAWTLGCLALALLALPARAQEILLAWKWTEGDERRYFIESGLKQSVTIDGPQEEKEREVNVTHTFHVVERVTEVTDDGIATVTHTYERVQVRGTDDGPDGIDRFEYDSALRSRTTSPTRPGSPARPGQPRPGTQNDADHPMVAPYAALAGRTITYRIDPEGHVLSCTGADESLEGAFDAMDGDGNMNPALMLFRAAVTNDSLARQFESSLGLIPNRVVRRGESWDISVQQTLPLVGDLSTDMECRLTSIRGRPGSRQVASIDNEGGMSLQGGPAGVQSLGGLFQVSLGMSDMSGTTEFDADGGFITTSRQRSVSEWEVYAPDFSDLDRMGEAVKTVQRLEQDVTMRLER